MRSAVLCAVLVLSACHHEDEGGITAHLVFGDEPGTKRSALRTAELPTIVDRLQILALDVDGSTLAETNLWSSPADDQLMLRAEGGTWELSSVRAGDNRTVLAKAFLGPSTDPNLDRALAFVGRRNGIQVRVGEVTDAGIIVLEPTPIRIPEADFDAPSSPAPLSASPIPTGEGLRVTFGTPPEVDTAGFLLAIGTSSAAANPPMLERGRSVAVGEQIAPGLRVETTWPIDGPQIIDINRLENGVQYGIVVYAFDDDRLGSPLNFSRPATTSGTPIDSVAPSAPGGLTVVAGGAGAAISFVSPGEDEGSGTPARYEIRAAADRASVEDGFESLPPIVPPPPQAGGTNVAFMRTYAELGSAPSSDFWIGVRAVDDASNVGPIAVALHTVNATLTPTIDRLVPHIAIAGLEVRIQGRNFGTATGTVSLTATETSTLTFPLFVSQWTPSTISVALPADARSGILSIVRPDGDNTSTYLTVIQRVDALIDDHEFPFEMIGTGRSDDLSIAALYREGNDFAPYEGAIQRIYDDVDEGVAYVPYNQPQRSTAMGGTYSPSYDLFMFAASNDPLSMTTAFISSSTIAPDAQRQVAGVAAGDADGVAMVFLDGGTGGAAPAMIAFTRAGTIRTATVADAVTQPFDAFYATSSTVASYENVKMARSTSGEILMAYRTVTGTVAELTLRINTTGHPGEFTLVPAASRPRVGANFEVRSVPNVLGGPESFVVAYEEIGPSGTDIRLLRLSQYGARSGYAPFVSSADDRRLDDVGLVVRNGQVWIAVLATRVNGTAELSYAELPATGLDTPDGMRGVWPGVILDSAPNDSVARIGCKPFVQRACPMAWLGDDTRVFFIRR